MFFIERLKISKYSQIKCLLETNLASSVKPTINLYLLKQPLFSRESSPGILTGVYAIT